MRRPQFFFSSNQIKDGLVCLTDTDAHHIRKVLRLKVGDTIIVSDGFGKSYLASLERIDKDTLCNIKEEINTETLQCSPRITLVQGLTKGDKMDFIVQKGTELGLHGIIPLISERVIVKLTQDKLTKRRERWQRIALEASKQSRRRDVPAISSPQTWSQVLENLPLEAVTLIPWEDETERSLKSILQNNQKPSIIYFFIGPEGGFSPSEVEMARKHGVRPVTLGPRILRTETAGLAVTAMLLYQWGDLGGS